MTKSFWLLIFVAMTTFACNNPTSKDCNEIIISPISDQKLYENTRSYIPISVATAQLDNIICKIIGPSFIKNKNTHRGRFELILDPSTEDIGEHQVTIETTDGKRYGCLSFTIKVKSIHKSKRIIHCYPSQKEASGENTNSHYPSLSVLLDSGFVIKSNDIIVLHDGDHGSVTLSGSGYEIVSANNSTARLTDLSIANANDITISGLEIHPTQTTGMNDKYLVYIDSTSQNITFNNNKVLSSSNSKDWTIKDWNQRAARGIKCLTKNAVISNNLVQNVFHGIKIEGAFIQTIYNHVDRFAGDAIRNTGSNNAFNYNYLTNATVDDYYDEGGNHDDLFQSWTFDKPIDNISLNNNIMISCIDTLIPLRAKIVQGLVCFDGFTTNWKVHNNLIITDHPHGIALYGAENCTIHDNTVLKNPNNLYNFESDPWIMINNHKDGRLSKTNKVKNNITSALAIVSDDVEVSGNTVIDSTKRQELNNYYDWDFRFKK